MLHWPKGHGYGIAQRITSLWIRGGGVLWRVDPSTSAMVCLVCLMEWHSSGRAKYHVCNMSQLVIVISRLSNNPMIIPFLLSDLSWGRDLMCKMPGRMQVLRIGLLDLLEMSGVMINESLFIWNEPAPQQSSWWFITRLKWEVLPALCSDLVCLPWWGYDRSLERTPRPPFPPPELICTMITTKRQ